MSNIFGRAIVLNGGHLFTQINEVRNDLRHSMLFGFNKSNRSKIFRLLQFFNNLLKNALDLDKVMEVNVKYITRFKSYLNNNMEIVNKHFKKNIYKK